MAGGKVGLGTYVVVGEDELLADSFLTAMSLFNLLAILLDCLLEDRPFDTAYKAALHPSLDGLGPCSLLLLFYDPFVEPRDDLPASSNPFVPISPDEWPSISFLLKVIQYRRVARAYASQSAWKLLERVDPLVSTCGHGRTPRNAHC